MFSVLKKIIRFFIGLLPRRLETAIYKMIFSVTKHRYHSYGEIQKYFPVNKNLSSTKEILFSHSGHLGDILYSLYFCRELSAVYGMESFNFHIRTNVASPELKNLKHPCCEVRITLESAKFLGGLLENQRYINRVSYGDELPENAIDLDLFRKLPVNFSAGHIPDYYYDLVDKHLPRLFGEKIISVEPDYKYHDKIAVIATCRYRNVFVDMGALKPFREHLVFVGLPEEYEDFCKKYFTLEYMNTGKSMHDIARCFSCIKGVIGNQSGLFALAECMKIPRILIAADFFELGGRVVAGPCNVIPQGGWCERVSTTAKLVSVVKELVGCFENVTDIT